MRLPAAHACAVPLERLQADRAAVFCPNDTPLGSRRSSGRKRARAVRLALTAAPFPPAAYFTEISLPLEHALGADATWTAAGTLHARANFDKSGRVRYTQLKVARDAPSKADAAALNALLAAGGLYRARLPANALAPTDRHVVAFLPLRCLVEAGLAEHLSLSVDEAGRVYGFELAPPGGACAPQAGAPPKPPAAWVLRSTASVRLPKEAPPLPSTAALAVNASTLDAVPEPDGAAPASMTPPPPERSALAKYGPFAAIIIMQIAMRGLNAAPEERPAAAKKKD